MRWLLRHALGDARAAQSAPARRRRSRRARRESRARGTCDVATRRSRSPRRRRARRPRAPLERATSLFPSPPPPPPIARNADVRLSRACSSFPFASLFHEKQPTSSPRWSSTRPASTSRPAIAAGAWCSSSASRRSSRWKRHARIWIERRIDRRRPRHRASAGAAKHLARTGGHRYSTEFQSHEPEFDYLKSLEIEEKINTLRWCHHSANTSRFLISTNDKTIKLWKVLRSRSSACPTSTWTTRLARTGEPAPAESPRERDAAVERRERRTNRWFHFWETLWHRRCSRRCRRELQVRESGSGVASSRGRRRRAITI